MNKNCFYLFAALSALLGSQAQADFNQAMAIAKRTCEHLMRIEEDPNAIKDQKICADGCPQFASEWGDGPWQQIPVTIYPRSSFITDPFIVADKKSGVYVKTAASRNEAPAYIPFIESYPAGRRDMMYRVADVAFEMGLTDATSFGQLDSGLTVTIQTYYADARSIGDGGLQGELKSLANARGSQAMNLAFAVLVQRQVGADNASVADVVEQFKTDPRVESLERFEKMNVWQFQGMGMLDMVLAHRDRTPGNWGILRNGTIKTWDNRKILNRHIELDARVATYDVHLIPENFLGPIDPIAREKMLSITPDQFNQLMSEIGIPWIYRVSAVYRFKRLQKLLGKNVTFATLLKKLSTGSIKSAPSEPAR
jgi:hypothetical protein